MDRPALDSPLAPPLVIKYYYELSTGLICSVSSGDVVNGGGESHDRVECSNRPDNSGLIIAGRDHQLTTVTPASTRHRPTVTCTCMNMVNSQQNTKKISHR